MKSLPVHLLQYPNYFSKFLLKSGCDLDSAYRTAMTFHAASSNFFTSVKVLLTPSISPLSLS